MLSVLPVSVCLSDLMTSLERTGRRFKFVFLCLTIFAAVNVYLVHYLLIYESTTELHEEIRRLIENHINNSSNMDVKAKLERSRQSARECRARKKLRYQYLEELVTEREKAVLLLRKELDKYRQWSKEIEEGKVPDGFEAFLETFFDGDLVKSEQ